MSRSRKLPIYKDGGIATHVLQRRKIRRRIRQAVQSILSLQDPDEYEIPAEKVLVNDYDWCDFVLDYREFEALPNLWKRSVDEIEEYMREQRCKMSRK